MTSIKSKKSNHPCKMNTKKRCTLCLRLFCVPRRACTSKLNLNPNRNFFSLSQHMAQKTAVPPLWENVMFLSKNRTFPRSYGAASQDCYPSDRLSRAVSPMSPDHYPPMKARHLPPSPTPPHSPLLACALAQRNYSFWC